MSSSIPELAQLLRQVTDDDLRELVGDASLRRGREYVRQRRVGSLRPSGSRGVVATVRGSGRSYSTHVELSQRGEFLGGDCSCPIGGDCKHVVAVTITARETFGMAGGASRPGSVGQAGVAAVRPLRAVPTPPAWEQVLAGIVTAPADSTPQTSMGLLLQVTAPRPSYYGAEPGHGTPRITLRPVIPGKTGWIKTGVQWSRLDYLGYGTAAPVPRQQQALQRLQAMAGAAQRYYSASETIDLEHLGDGWLDALRQCHRAGVTLLTDQRRSGEVRLATDPACLAIDLVRAADGGIRLLPSVALPDEFDDSAAADDARSWITVGSPPRGLWSVDGNDLWLAGFDPPLDAESARLLHHGPLDIPAADVTRFLTAVAPVLARRFRVASPDGSVQVGEVAPPRVQLRLTHLPDVRLALTWSFRYQVGPDAVRVGLDSTDHAALRDRDAEAALLADLIADLPPRLVRPPTPTRGAVPEPAATLVGFDVVDFLNRVVPRLAAHPDVDLEIGGEEITYTEAVHPPTVRLALTESDPDAGPDWFDLSVAVSVGDEDVPMASLITALTLGQPQVILPTGTWFRVDRPELADLRRLVEEARAMQDDPRGPLRLSPYQSDLWSELEALGIVEEQSERWSRLVKGLSTESLEPVAAPAGLQATLRPYQQDGYSWLTFLRRHELGGVLADDMGLGKTMQALAMIVQAREEAPDDAPWLVVAPASVLAVWAGEAARFAPGLRVAVASTTNRRGAGVGQVPENVDLVVTSYAVFRLDESAFAERAWSGLILDEAQAAKNHQSATYQCARRLSAGVKFAITGTPMENNLMELWSLLSIVAPGLFPHPKAFTEHFRRPIESGSAPERLDTLRRRIRPVMLRRTKNEVARDLPPKQEQVVHVELPPKHRRVYDRGLARQRQRVLGLLEDAARNRIAIFRALTALRQLSLHPGLVEPEHRGQPCAKIDTLIELMSPVIAEGHKVLVFSQFTSFLALVRERLVMEGVLFSYLDGTTRDRQQVVEEFRTGAHQVFLISLKAGGVGLTLTEADYVFLLDPWWNPAVEAQAIDRTHRIGQDKPVNVYRLVSADTIEDKVVALQNRKRELFASVVDDGALASGSLTADDIRGLL
ncbi:MAG: DEAD/DEAH box helicase [Kineosporiaceae bacterium]